MWDQVRDNINAGEIKDRPAGTDHFEPAAEYLNENSLKRYYFYVPLWAILNNPTIVDRDVSLFGI